MPSGASTATFHLDKPAITQRVLAASYTLVVHKMFTFPLQVESS